VILAAAQVLAAQGFAASGERGSTDAIVRKKKADGRSSTNESLAALPVRLVWQVIRSQGQGAMMNTSAETFSADGLLAQVGISSWELRAKKSSIFGYYIPPKFGMDGRLVLQRAELLAMLGIISKRSEDLEGSTDGGEGADVLHIPILQSPNRQLETIYRGPEEELLLVKVSVTTNA
jgi:hypothetical protein